MKYDVKEAEDYLADGGLGEVIGLTHGAKEMGSEKVQMDTDMAMALCLLADEGLKARRSQ
ncbi:hypothetical protein [Shinella sp.]|uniref:hypothetical protein n=1 Tax=Shinella sp. TaxID=1870904 RepID=UPI0028A048CB|nr:hypothetical protein [Shinella sp.]